MHWASYERLLDEYHAARGAFWGTFDASHQRLCRRVGLER